MNSKLDIVTNQITVRYVYVIIKHSEYNSLSHFLLHCSTICNRLTMYNVGHGTIPKWSHERISTNHDHGVHAHICCTRLHIAIALFGRECEINI